MKEWALRWVKKLESIPVETKTEPVAMEKTCKKDGHDYGRVKQWILPDGVAVRKRKCRRCQGLEE